MCLLTCPKDAVLQLEQLLPFLHQHCSHQPIHLPSHLDYPLLMKVCPLAVEATGGENVESDSKKYLFLHIFRMRWSL